MASTGAPDPPQYTDYLGHIIPHLDDVHLDSELPAYTQPPIVPRETKEFRYVVNTNAHLEMTLITGASYSKNTPIFIQGSPVEGKIHLKLERPDSIHKIVVSVNGWLLTGATNFDGYKLSFLDQHHTVWSQEGKAKLHGEYTWPFSIELPEEIEMEGITGKKFRLPHSFVQRYVKATIRYEISVKLVRNSILKSDITLSAPFSYIPVIRPPAFSALRRLAYEEGTPLLGPKDDPDGWFLQKSVQVQGDFFNDHPARVECKLFLANPLSYTRGSFIPLFLTLESDDEQVLDLLSSPSAIGVRVRRYIRWNPEAHRPLETKVWRTQVEHSQRAVWWRANVSFGEKPTPGIRNVAGELHLKPAMEPTFEIGNFKIDYSVVLYQFEAPGLPTAKLASEVLLEQPVTIVTSFATGPRPKATTPADYTPDAKRHAGQLQVDKQYSFGFY